MRLLAEEHEEVREELIKFIQNPVSGDRPALAKELADMLYVVYGTASMLDIDLDYALEAVHKSNLSKLDAEGKPILRCRREGHEGAELQAAGPQHVRPNRRDVRGCLETKSGSWEVASTEPPRHFRTASLSRFRTPFTTES